MSNTDSLKEVHKGDGMEVVQPAPEVVPNHGRIRKYCYEGGDDFNRMIADEPSRIFGMRKVTFLLAIAVVIMVGIIIGLSVGLTKGVHQRNASTPTSSSPSPIASSATSSNPCPAENGQLKQMDTMAYRVHCEYDYRGGQIENLVLARNMTFDSCLWMCDQVNSLRNRTDIGSTFYLPDAKAQHPGSCWCVGNVKSNVTGTVSAPGRVISVPQSQRWAD